MKNKWIMDVLLDLRAYALQNDLPNLAEHLEEASLLAATEMASNEGSEVNGQQTSRIYQGPGAGGNA
ncbi:hypothetical protein [Pseudaestuariivita rosea]|uniref:hypothetical protein n=1 Tax=Pseudaestuariivita rosea TaxID=2763263 RepID=UPI001ABAA64B|nr:hypothetical protein [Pseudaestuariivita rosea]